MKLYYDNLFLKYEGETKSGKMHGKGILYDRYSERKIYEGGWKDGQRHGVGIEYYSDGKRKEYDGEWKVGYRNGYGISYHPDGKTKQYEGYWKNNYRNGHGSCYYIKGVKLYEGVWKRGTKEGKGIEYGYDKSKIILNTIYSGTFKKNRKHGVFSVHYPITNNKFYNIKYTGGKRRLCPHFIRDNHPTFNLDLSGIIASY